jgi:ribose transport system substrate-binding protein
MRMRALGKLTMTAAGLALSTTACSASNGDTNTKVIHRQTLPTNDFTPTALESTIDDLVTKLGTVPPVDMKQGVLLKDVTSFWAPVVSGANRALAELQVTGSVVGPVSPTGDQDQNVQLQLMWMQEALASGYDSLGLAPQSSTLDDEINAYKAKGLPVVTLDSDAPGSTRDLYLGTINHNAGITGGKTLLGMLPPTPGTVIILGTTDTTWTDGIERTSGAQGVLTAAGYDVQVISTDWTTTGEASNVAALQTALTGASPPAVGMIGLFSVSYRCAEAAQANNLTGDEISIVAFDYDPQTVTYMQSGLIKATHVQRAYYEGYLTPYVLYGIKALGLDQTKAVLQPQLVDESRFDTGLDTVLAAQVSAYNAFLDSIGANVQ